MVKPFNIKSTICVKPTFAEEVPGKSLKKYSRMQQFNGEVFDLMNVVQLGGDRTTDASLIHYDIVKVLEETKLGRNFNM